MNGLSEQQIAMIRKNVSAYRYIRNPRALIEGMIPPQFKEMMNGNNYDAITENLLRNAGYDPETVREQLAGII